MPTSSHALGILIVDDYPDTAASCAELLKLCGHDARAADDVGAALALLDGWRPDVALLDLRMPGLDGFELARWLRVRSESCPLLVAVTGVETRAYQKRAAEVGFDYFLVKPVRLQLLIDLLREYSASLSPNDTRVTHESTTRTHA